MSDDLVFELASPDVVAAAHRRLAELGIKLHTPVVKGWKDSKNKVPQHRYDIEIVDYWSPIIRNGIRTFVNSLPIRSTIDRASGLVTKDAETDAIAAKVRGMLGDSGSMQDIRDAVYGVLTDGYVSGALGAAEQVGGINASVGAVVAGAPWDSWKPGSPAAADKLENGGLRQMLDDADITIQSVEDNMLDTVGNKIAAGMRAGDPSDVIAKDIEDSLTAPYRAQMIAQTEGARAQTQASMDSYEAAGIEEWELIVSDNACDVCEGAAQDNPYALDDREFLPPIHPFCRCAASPVGGGGDGMFADNVDAEGNDWTGNTFAGFLIGFGIGLLGAALYDHFTEKAQVAPTEDEFPDEFDNEDGISTDLLTPLPGQRKPVTKEWDESLHPRDEKGEFTESGGMDAVQMYGTGADYPHASYSDLPELQNLSPVQTEARINYMQHGYEWMNEYLRTGREEELDKATTFIGDTLAPEDAKAQVTEFANALNENTTDKNMTVTRWQYGLDGVGLMSKLSDKEVQGLVGKAFEAKGFTSTSAPEGLQQSVTNSRKMTSDVLMNIHMPEGTHGATIGNVTENEFVLPPDTTFLVTGANRIDGGRVSLDLIVTGQGNG